MFNATPNPCLLNKICLNKSIFSLVSCCRYPFDNTKINIDRVVPNKAKIQRVFRRTFIFKFYQSHMDTIMSRQHCNSLVHSLFTDIHV